MKIRTREHQGSKSCLIAQSSKQVLVFRSITQFFPLITILAN